MTRSLPLLVLFALLAGCEGTIGAPGASGDPSDRPPDDGAAPHVSLRALTRSDDDYLY